MTEKMESFLAQVEERGWICPQPKHWNQMWEMLPEKLRSGSSWEPPLPLILAAWWHSTDLQKNERFVLHLNWADTHGVTSEVLAFLESLPPNEWHTNK